MGTPANIIIEYFDDTFSLTKQKDQILLFCDPDGYPFSPNGVVHLVVKAYKNLKSHPKNTKNSIMLTPDNFAIELMRLSYYKDYGQYRILPASRLMYQQFDKVGYFVDCAFKYLCTFEIDSSSVEMTLTVKGGGHESSNTMDEWKKICDVVNSIVIAQDEKIIILNDIIPCNSDECLVRATCVVRDDQRGTTYVTGPCGDLKKYKEGEIERLREELPDWAIPFVFWND